MIEGFHPNEHDASINVPSRAETRQPERHTPFYTATLDLVHQRIPEVEAGVKVALDSIDRQAVDNFHVFKSQEYPGVEFTVSKVAITPDDIHAIAKAMEPHPIITVKQPQDPEAIPVRSEPRHDENEKIVYFLFPPFNPPGADHALVHMDMLIDRFMRELPEVAGAMKRGEPIPRVEAYSLGSTTGLGGKESKDALKEKKKDGFDVHGAYYAEYIASQLPTTAEELANTRIVLQGVSRGTFTAASAYSHLSTELQAHTQILADGNVDNGMRVVNGFRKETLWHMKNNPFMKVLGKAGKGFPEYLSQTAGIEKDSFPDTVRKLRGSARDAINLVKGKTPMPTDTERIYMRQGIEDPLRDSTDLEGRTVKTIGRSIMAPVKGRHFFDLYQRTSRWKKNAEYCESAVAALNKAS